MKILAFLLFGCVAFGGTLLDAKTLAPIIAPIIAPQVGNIIAYATSDAISQKTGNAALIYDQPKLSLFIPDVRNDIYSVSWSAEVRETGGTSSKLFVAFTVNGATKNEQIVYDTMSGPESLLASGNMALRLKNDETLKIWFKGDSKTRTFEIKNCRITVTK